MEYWTGTYLVVVYLIPEGAKLWPSILKDWATAGLLQSGTAEIKDVHPSGTTVERILDAESLPSITWSSGPEPVLPLFESHFVVEILLSFDMNGIIREAKCDAVINDDDALSIYLSVPYEAVYAQHPPSVGVRNLRQFVDIACRFFPVDHCLVGAIGEEKTIDGLTDAIANPQTVSDWALYGTWMAQALIDEFRDELPQLRANAKEWRVLSDRGLFVRWTDWSSEPWAPSVWTQAVARVLQCFLLRGGSSVA